MDFAVPLDPVETLQRLIQTPSVNPMGREVSGPEFGESRMSDLLAGICEKHGWPYFRQPVHPGRENLVAVIEGDPPASQGGEVLLWDVHQDTVATEGMTVTPFGGEVRDGRVYGRGACDVKGPMAAMLAALSRVTEIRPAKLPTIVLACTANEECGFTGASALATLWQGASRAPGMGIEAVDEAVFRRLPHAAIVAEPTDFNVIVAHNGVVRWRCHTLGRAAHTSRPDLGVNAIYAMAQIVRGIEAFHQLELRVHGETHPLCGRPSVCVSTIHGGIGVNTVPDRATIEIDRRLSPAEQPDAAYAQLIGFLQQQADIGACHVKHEPPFMQSRGLSDRDNRHIAQRLIALATKHGVRSEVRGAPYGTDAAAVAAAGVPTVVFGPGSIDQAHTADEFIGIDELALGTEIFYEIACNVLR